MIRHLLLAGLFVPVFHSSASAQKLTKVELARRGKAATAYVEVAATRISGTAFCIHASGLFVTNAHVVRGAETAEITLVLNPSLKDQRVLKAAVVRSDKDLDLALLRVESVSDLPTLSMGAADDVTELMDVVAVGFSFGRVLSTNQKEYPAVSVNAGSVTALRRKGTELDRIQLDVALNRGNSGGPVLDDQAKVVGVVVAGLAGGERVNQAIPVTNLMRFLNKLEIQFTPPELARAALRTPIEFTARIASFVPNAPEPSVRLVIKADGEAAREYPMQKRGGVFVATVVPLAAAARDRVEVTARFEAGSVSGSVANLVLKVGNTPVKLKDVRRIDLKPKPLVVRTDGKTAEGVITGLGAVEIEVGGQTVKLDLTKATQIQVQAAAEPQIAATVIVRVADKEVARAESPVLIRGGSVTAADPSSVAIHPPQLADEKVVKQLPEPFADVALGGGGRYLIFHLPKLRKLATFDVNEARIINYIPLAEDKVVFAAGLDKVVIGLPKKGILERWTLPGCQRETSVFPPFKDEIARILLGHASNGPVVVSGRFLDLATFQPLKIAFPNGGWEGSARLFVSGDGTVYGRWGDNSVTFVLEGGEVRRHEVAGVGHTIPGPDGKFTFTAKGPLSARMVRADPDDAKLGYCLPAVRGSYFLSLTPAGADGKGGGVTVHLPGYALPVAKPDRIEHGVRFNDWDREEFGAWMRIYLIPQANVILVLPASNDQIVLHKFDVDAALEQSGVDYLFVTSSPPRDAKAGAKWSYPLTVKAKRGGVTYKLDAGPAGMTVSATGVVEWKVPADAADGEQDVILTVRDAAGQETFHTFKIRVVK